MRSSPANGSVRAPLGQEAGVDLHQAVARWLIVHVVRPIGAHDLEGSSRPPTSWTPTPVTNTALVARHCAGVVVPQRDQHRIDAAGLVGVLGHETRPAPLAL